MQSLPGLFGQGDDCSKVPSERAVDGVANSRTLSDVQYLGRTMASGAQVPSIRFRNPEPKNPVNRLINRDFLNMVVKGTTEFSLQLYD